MKQTFVGLWRRRVEKKYKVIYKRGPSTIAFIFLAIALISWFGFLVATGFPIAQYAYYKLQPKTSELLARALLKTAQATEESELTRPQTPAVEGPRLPERDISLPEGHYLTIPKIGVDTIIWEGPADKYLEIIKKGVWRADDLSDPEQAKGKPILLVAHRFGFLEWTQDYRTKNSFFNLPKLVAGDTIEIVWNQRRYKYVVSAIQEGEEIGSYNHDLILYTCKFLVSPLRIFVYADRVN